MTGCNIWGYFKRATTKAHVFYALVTYSVNTSKMSFHTHPLIEHTYLTCVWLPSCLVTIFCNTFPNALIKSAQKNWAIAKQLLNAHEPACEAKFTQQISGATTSFNAAHWNYKMTTQRFCRIYILRGHGNYMCLWQHSYCQKWTSNANYCRMKKSVPGNTSYSKRKQISRCFPKSVA